MVKTFQWRQGAGGLGRGALVTALTCIFLAAGALHGQGKKKPCEGGELRVRHAYSECREKVWHVVEIGYYLCPPNNRVEEVELSARPTQQACEKGKEGRVEIPWSLAASDYRELQGDSTCVDPSISQPLVLLECIAGSWAFSTYDFYECKDGTKRIKKPATRIDRTSTACTDTPPKYTFK